MNAQQLAALLEKKGYSIPAEILAEAKVDHKEAIVAVQERKEENYNSLVMFLNDTQSEVSATMESANFLAGTSFVLRGRVEDNGTILVTVENAHSSGTKKPIHLDGEGSVVTSPVRNKRDYLDNE